MKCVVIAFLAILALVATSTATAQAVFPKGRDGTASWQVDGATAWSIGHVQEFEHIIGPLDCDRLVLEITVQPKFWDLKVFNRYSCHCNPSSDCETPSWSLRELHPFMVNFTDVRMDVPRQLLTRRNAPGSNGYHPTAYVVTNALDLRQVTDAVRIGIQFFPKPTSTFESDLETKTGFECFPTPHRVFETFDYLGKQKTSYRLGSRRRMGTTLRREGEVIAPGHPSQQWTLDRKPPFPSFELTIKHECAGTAGSTGPLVTAKTQLHTGISRAAVTLPAFGSAGSCCTLSWPYTDCDCYNYTASVEFFETVRLHEATYSFQQPTGPYDYTNPMSASIAPDPVTAIAYTEGGKVDITPADDTNGLQFRFQHIDMGSNTSEYNLTDVTGNFDRQLDDNHTVLGLYLLQPFPIKDVWVTVTDNNGTVMFEEQEVHVPYVKKTAQGQFGWMFAIDHRPTEFAWGINVVVRYNRRHHIGNRPEEVKARQLLNWIEDLGGMGQKTGRVLSPIPTTVLNKPNVLGAVVKEHVWNGWDLLKVPSRGVLTSEIALEWYHTTLAQKCTTRPDNIGSGGNTSNCSMLILNRTMESDNRALDKTIMALFVVMRGVNPHDGTSSWFNLFDTFYPERPMHLPWFFDEDSLERLLGFSEIPRLVRKKLEFWRIEYGILSHAFPWFKNEVSLYRWQNVRAWVMASAYDNGTHYSIVPGVNLLRHGKVPNTKPLIIDSATGTVRLEASEHIREHEEIFPDFNPAGFSKHEYYMTYGQTPDASSDVATIPRLDRFLYNNAFSRWQVATELAAMNGESYKDGLARLLSLIGVKLGTLPLSIDGLGSDPDTVILASAILNSERTVLTQQFADGTAEYATL